MVPPDPFGLVGQVLDGQFRVDRFIGEGGFGAVYAGRHLGLQEPIAIKCMKLPPHLAPALVESFVQRFRDESRLHYKLSQGNLHIARTMAAGTANSPVTRELVPYMVLEWLDGRSMAAEFEQAPVRRTLHQVIELFETAADALSYAQSQGVIHRDLNPGNFFLTNTLAGKRLKVLDFGVAKVLDESRLAVGPRAQTLGQIRIFAPAYGAPEQFDDRLGPVGPYTDVYSLALVLLEAMAGRTVMSGAHLGDFAQGALDPVTRPSPRAVGLTLGPEVEAVFARALALRPADRWPTVKELWSALRLAARLPATAAEDDGKATQLLASMDLSPAPPGPTSDRTLVLDVSDEKSTVAEVIPDALLQAARGEPQDPARAPTAQFGAPPEGWRPLAPPPPGAAQGPAPVQQAHPGPLGPQQAHPGPLGPQQARQVPLVQGAGPIGAPQAPQAALVSANTGPRPEPSQKATMHMSSRPFLPGAQGSPANANANAPPRVLAGTMAMAQAPTMPANAAFDRPSLLAQSIQPHVPPAGAPMQAVLLPSPQGLARRPESDSRQRLSQPDWQERHSEPPAPPQHPSAPQWHANPLPPQPFVPATPAPQQRVDDEPVAVPKSRVGLVVVAVIVVLGVLAAGVVLALRVRPTAHPAPEDASIFSAQDPSAASPSASSPPAASASVAPSAAVPDPPPTASPSASASAAPVAPTVSPTPLGPGRKPVVAPVAPSDPNAFNPAQARAKLDQANGVLVICKKPGGPSGKGTASVVFAPSGQVTSVSLDGMFAGSPVGACVTGQLLRVKTTPFTGQAQPMAYTFTVPK